MDAYNIQLFVFIVLWFRNQIKRQAKTWCWLEHIGVPKNLAFVMRISRWSKIRVECRLGGPQWRCHSCGCHWLRLLQSESSCHCHLGVEGDGTRSFFVERSNESTGTGSWTKVWETLLGNNSGSVYCRCISFEQMSYMLGSPRAQKQSPPGLVSFSRGSL